MFSVLMVSLRGRRRKIDDDAAAVTCLHADRIATGGILARGDLAECEPALTSVIVPPSSAQTYLVMIVWV